MAKTYFKGSKFIGSSWQRRIQKTHVKNRTLKTVCANVPLMFSNFTSGETLQISHKMNKNSPIFSQRLSANLFIALPENWAREGSGGGERERER
jgi:hypothetical protein